MSISIVMKTKTSNWSNFLGVTCITVASASFSPCLGQNHAAWIAPKTADTIVNPLGSNPKAILDGQKIYTSMCAICHGDSGKGNGTASVALDPRPANFLRLDIRNESDGAIFWKLTEGRPPMASYKTLLTDQQRWQLVNYIRRLEKK